MIVTIVLVLGGCSRRQQEWETARKADTVEAYRTFLKTFPDGEFASQAQARVRELEEASDWEQAQAANTAESYQQFLDRYPQGRMSDEARIRIENFALSQAPAEMPPQAATIPEEAVPDAAVPPQSSPPVATPASKPGPPAPTKTASSPGGGYRIQLGAFSGSDKKAMSEWRRLEGQYPKLLKGLTPSVKLATTSSGHLYRLQAGMTNEARAREICSALKARNQACVVVLP